MLCGGGALLQKGLLPHAPTPQNLYSRSNLLPKFQWLEAGAPCTPASDF